MMSLPLLSYESCSELEISSPQELIAFDGRRAHDNKSGNLQDRYSILFFLAQNAWEAENEELIGVYGSYSESQT